MYCPDLSRRHCAASLLLCGAWPSMTPAQPTTASGPLPPFKRLRLDGALDLQLLPDGETALELPPGQVRVWVEGDTLHLMAPVAGTVASELGLSARPQLRLHHPARQLDSIELRGSSQVQIGALQAAQLKLLLGGSGGLRIDSVSADRLELAVQGSGHLQLGDVRVQQLTLRLSGSGGVSIATGRALQQDWMLSGSGDVKAPRLQGRQVKLRSFGSGDAELGAVEQLQLSLYGSGDVSYAGTPSLQLWMPGSGSLRARAQ